MTCNDCIHYDVCPKPYYGEKLCCNDVEERCENFKNKADFVEVVRCGKCKHGGVSVFSKTVDGEEGTACYCTIKNKVTDKDSYCPSGERSDT
jgi:hypothetical protein